MNSPGGSPSCESYAFPGRQHRALLVCVRSDDPSTLMYACGTVQNLCHHDDWARVLVANGVHHRLEEVKREIPPPALPHAGG